MKRWMWSGVWIQYYKPNFASVCMIEKECRLERMLSPPHTYVQPVVSVMFCIHLHLYLLLASASFSSSVTLFPPGFEFEATQMISHCYYSYARERASSSEDVPTTTSMLVLRDAFTNYILSHGSPVDDDGQQQPHHTKLHHSRALYIWNMDSRSVAQGSITRLARNYPGQNAEAENSFAPTPSLGTLISDIALDIQKQRAGMTEGVCLRPYCNRIPYRIPYTVYRIPYTVYRIPYTVYRIASAPNVSLYRIRFLTCFLPFVTEDPQYSAWLRQGEIHGNSEMCTWFS
jgi:hypothetical protein